VLKKRNALQLDNIVHEQLFHSDDVLSEHISALQHITRSLLCVLVSTLEFIAQLHCPSPCNSLVHSRQNRIGRQRTGNAKERMSEVDGLRALVARLSSRVDALEAEAFRSSKVAARVEELEATVRELSRGSGSGIGSGGGGGSSGNSSSRSSSRNTSGSSRSSSAHTNNNASSSPAMPLSVDELLAKWFKTHARRGKLSQDVYKAQCTQHIDNFLSHRLWRLADVGKSGSVTLPEFLTPFTLLLTGCTAGGGVDAGAAAASLVFQILDLERRGKVSRNDCFELFDWACHSSFASAGMGDGGDDDDDNERSMCMTVTAVDAERAQQLLAVEYDADDAEAATPHERDAARALVRRREGEAAQLWKIVDDVFSFAAKHDMVSQSGKLYAPAVTSILTRARGASPPPATRHFAWFEKRMLAQARKLQRAIQGSVSH
jgi:hypothetical protein